MQRKRQEISQGAVEFALVLPVLLLIIFGMLEMGHLIFVYASVLNASREAARYGAVTGSVPGFAHQYMNCQGIKDAAKRVKFLANFTDNDVAIFYDEGPGPAPAYASPNPAAIGPCAPGLNWGSIKTGSRIVVTITSPYALMLPLVPIPNFNIVSTSARTILGSVDIAGEVVGPPPSGGGDTPTISTVNPAFGSALGGTDVTITGDNFTGGTVYFEGATCVVDSTVQITCTTSAHAVGKVDVYVTTVDGISNYKIFEYIPSPTISSITPSSGQTLGGETVIIAGSYLTGGTVKFDGITAACTVDSDTQITCTTPVHPIAGMVNVVVTNTAGDTAAIAFTYVPPPPTITSISPTFGTVSGETLVTINGTYLTGAAVTFGGTPTPVPCILILDTQINCTTPSYATDGKVDVAVTTLGGTATLVQGFTYNLLPPTLTKIDPPSGPTTGGTNVIITGTNFGPGTITAMFGSAPVTCTVNSATQTTCKTPVHATPESVDVSVTTSGGTSNTKSFTYVMPPTVTSISPVSGLTTGLTATTITGTSLTNGTVSFGGTPATSCTVISDTQINCPTPAHTTGVVDVVVTTPGGTATLAAAYTYIPLPPTITSISPATGPTTGGTNVTITGTYLTGATVTFGIGTNQQACIILSTPPATDTQITCTTPPYAAGKVDVNVTTAGGTATKVKVFEYFAPPTINASGIAPIFGSTRGGTTVTITGSNLTNATVTFDVTTATCVADLITPDTKISCTTPAHATPPQTGVPVNVIVTTAGGTVTKSNAFTYYPFPSITGVTKNYGKTHGGTTVTITGTNFDSGTTVTFGGVNCPVTLPVPVGSPTLTCTTPAHVAGLVNVVVSTTTFGSGIAEPNTLSNAYTYIGPPTIDISQFGGYGFTPNSGKKSTTLSPMTIVGTNFVVGDTTAQIDVETPVSCTVTPTVTGSLTGTTMICNNLTIPKNAGTYHVKVITMGDGTYSAVTSSTNFTANP